MYNSFVDWHIFPNEAHKAEFLTHLNQTHATVRQICIVEHGLHCPSGGIHAYDCKRVPYLKTQFKSLVGTVHLSQSQRTILSTGTLAMSLSTGKGTIVSYKKPVLSPSSAQCKSNCAKITFWLYIKWQLASNGEQIPAVLKKNV